MVVKKVFTPYKYKLINKLVDKKKRIKVLDVGCGARAGDIARFSLNLEKFDGVDNQIWHNDEASYIGIDKLFDIDLENQGIEEIPTNNYDVIIVSHLIEHISNGESLIESLCSKLVIGGIIYIETPSPKTFNLPSAVGFANFYDDKTHKRMYFPHEILKVLVTPKMQVISYGIRRDIVRLVLFSPVMVLLNAFYFYPFKRKYNFKDYGICLGCSILVCSEGGAMKKIAITGGFGFIGLNLIRSLLDGSCQIRVLDNLTNLIQITLTFWMILSFTILT